MVASTAVKIATCWPNPGVCAACSTAWSCGPWTCTPCSDMCLMPGGVERRRPSSARTPFPLLARSSLSADVVLELLDGEVLVGDDVAHDVADRYHPDHAALVHHRQVA